MFSYMVRWIDQTKNDVYVFIHGYRYVEVVRVERPNIPSICHSRMSTHFEPAMLFNVFRYSRSTLYRYKILLCREVLYRNKVPIVYRYT